MYRFAEAPSVGRGAHPARLVGSGPILGQVLAARDLLAEKFGVAAEVYSAPSFPLLRREALEAERWNRLHPDAKDQRVPLVSQILPPDGGPIIAATDWMKALPDMVSRWLPTTVPVARHGRLRPERHARGPARPVRDRRAAHRGGDDRCRWRAAARCRPAKAAKAIARARHRP